MTTTALMPLDPSVSPQQAARILTIRADLLPQDVRDGRRARRTRAFVLIMLMLVLAGLGGWYAVAAADKSAAEDEYNRTLQQLAKVQKRQQEDKDVQKMVQVKKGNTLLEGELKKLLTKDMSWARVIELVRDTADGAGVTVNEINGSLEDEGTGAATSASRIGTLQVSGSAKAKKDVAEYVEKLSSLTYLSNPFVSTVTEEKKGQLTFSLTVRVTDAGLCGRFTATKCNAGGK